MQLKMTRSSVRNDGGLRIRAVVERLITSYLGCLSRPEISVLLFARV